MNDGHGLHASFLLQRLAEEQGEEWVDRHRRDLEDQLAVLAEQGILLTDGQFQELRGD
ncbi:MAG: hypothetical protein WBB74_12715 [Gaiellaceae bacterium]